jgi:hypothetical protein
LTFAGRVRSSVVVVIEPGTKCVGPVLVAREWLPMGPLLLKRAVESLGFAVLPGLCGRVRRCRALMLARACRKSLDRR